MNVSQIALALVVVSLLGLCQLPQSTEAVRVIYYRPPITATADNTTGDKVAPANIFGAPDKGNCGKNESIDRNGRCRKVSFFG